jgi:hypothetical protein
MVMVDALTKTYGGSLKWMSHLAYEKQQEDQIHSILPQSLIDNKLKFNVFKANTFPFIDKARDKMHSGPKSHDLYHELLWDELKHIL